MTQNIPNTKKEKIFPATGIIFLCIFFVDAFLTSSYEIFLAIADPVFSIYKLIYLFWFLLRIPGLLLFPALFIIFLVQAIRLRKNHRYLQNCFLSVLGCALLVFLGNFAESYITPSVSEVIVEIKLNHYESTVEKIHRGKRNTDNLIGGVTGHEDVVFYQYTFSGDEEDYPGADTFSRVTRDTYILYSEDNICDVEIPKRVPSDFSIIDMEPIKGNWYKMIVMNSWRY